MPHIILTGISKEKTEQINYNLSVKVAETIGIPVERVFIECSNNDFFNNGKKVTDIITVHILWRKRPPQLEHQTAQTIAEVLKQETDKTVMVKYISLEDDELYTF